MKTKAPAVSMNTVTNCIFHGPTVQVPESITDGIIALAQAAQANADAIKAIAEMRTIVTAKDWVGIKFEQKPSAD
jgi:hypothetical protein